MSDMIILTRTFDLLAWLLPKAEKFPRLYRSTVTHRMMEAALRAVPAATQHRPSDQWCCPS